jgi:pimeloyl-ACP methyl ester carboxylesterase
LTIFRNFLLILKMQLQTLSTQKYPILQWNWRDNSIRYTVYGEGRSLLLVHGFGASIGHWRKNIGVLAAAGYRVFAIDLLGFGGSDKPALDYSLTLWQEQLQAFWQEKIQSPTVFVGNSIGGLLSLMMMADCPDLTAGGVVINCAGGLNHRPDELNLPLRLVMGSFSKLVNTPRIGSFLFEQIRQKKRIRNTLYQVYCDRKAVTDELVDLLYEPSCDPGAQKVFASVLSAPAGDKPETLLPRIQHPLLVLWGEADPWTPISGAKIYQERAVAGADTEFYTIPAAGHCPHDENPEQVNRFILDWLAQRNPA